LKRQTLPAIAVLSWWKFHFQGFASRVPIFERLQMVRGWNSSHFGHTQQILTFLSHILTPSLAKPS
jgi:hypothetical protein